MMDAYQAQICSVVQAVIGGPTPDYPVPEKKETIIAQMEWLKNGKRKALFLPPGSWMPVLPEGMHMVTTDKGMFYFNPEKISSMAIIEAADHNKIGDILDYGISEKPRMVDVIGAIVIRSKDGMEKQAVAVDNENLMSVWKAAHRMMDPEDRVSLESTDTIYKERLN